MKIDWETPNKAKPMSYGDVPIFKELSPDDHFKLDGKIVPSGHLPVRKLTIAELKAFMADYEGTIDEMVITAGQVEVIDDKTKELATTLGAQSHTFYRKIDDIRKDAVAEPNEFVKAVNCLFKPFLSKLKNITDGLGNKLTAYRKRVELEDRKCEAIAQQAVRELQERLNTEADAAGVERVILDKPIIPKSSTVTRTEDGSSYQRTNWKFRIIDETQVPRKYLTIDDMAINRDIRAGVREIPGLAIYSETLTSFRKV